LLFSLVFEFLTSLGLLSLPFRGGKSAPIDSVIVRESGRSSIPPAPVIEPKSRGVLDTGYDGGVLRDRLPHRCHRAILASNCKNEG
jgi:hypothetical protein